MESLDRERVLDCLLRLPVPPVPLALPLLSPSFGICRVAFFTLGVPCAALVDVDGCVSAFVPLAGVSRSDLSDFELAALLLPLPEPRVLSADGGEVSSGSWSAHRVR